MRQADVLACLLVADTEDIDVIRRRGSARVIRNGHGNSHIQAPAAPTMQLSPVLSAIM